MGRLGMLRLGAEDYETAAADLREQFNVSRAAAR